MELVSILIPSYKPTYFRQCLTSALAQSWPNTEIIVSDDCPSDDIQHICSEFESSVRYVRNPAPGRLGHNNIRHLCRISNGTYLKFLFDDDILHPFCVQYLMEALQANAACGPRLASSRRIFIDADNRPVIIPAGLTLKKGGVLTEAQLVRRVATTLRNPIGEFTTVLFRRADILSASGDIEIMSVEGKPWAGLTDVALFFHLLARGPAVILDEPLSYFRVHGQSNSNANVNPEWFYVIDDWRLVIEYAKKRGFLSKIDLAICYSRLIWMLRYWWEEAPSLRPELRRMVSELRGEILSAKLPWPVASALSRFIPTDGAAR